MEAKWGADGKQVLLNRADNGVGTSDETLCKALGPFCTALFGQGRGDIGIRSLPGQGSTCAAAGLRVGAAPGIGSDLKRP